MRSLCKKKDNLPTCNIVFDWRLGRKLDSKRTLFAFCVNYNKANPLNPPPNIKPPPPNIKPPWGLKL